MNVPLETLEAGMIVVATTSELALHFSCPVVSSAVSTWSAVHLVVSTYRFCITVRLSGKMKSPVMNVPLETLLAGTMVVETTSELALQ